ncbi:unnamed protein product [Sphagnum balticum]
MADRNQYEPVPGDILRTAKSHHPHHGIARFEAVTGRAVSAGGPLPNTQKHLAPDNALDNLKVLDSFRRGSPRVLAA